MSLAREYGVTTGDVLSRARTRTVVKCRHHMWRLLRDTLDLSYPEIGRIWGVDHTSVMTAVRNLRDRDTYSLPLQIVWGTRRIRESGALLSSCGKSNK